MSASTSTRSTARLTTQPPSTRSHRAARQRRWRAETGRVRTARVELVSLGRVLTLLDEPNRQLVVEAIGRNVARMALVALSAHDTQDAREHAEPA